MAGWLVTLIGGLVAVLVIALINGGYVYRTKWATGDGHVRTHWTYELFNFIPYIGTSETGCETHSGTHVALSALGIFPIHSHLAEKGKDVRAGNAVNELADIKERMDSLDQEILDLAPKPPLTAASVIAYGHRLEPKVEQLAELESEAIATRRSLLPIADADVTTAWALVIEKLRLEESGFRRVTGAIGDRTFSQADAASIRRMNDREAALIARLQPIVDRINARYGEK